MAREGMVLSVREGLNLKHQDLQHCLCSNIMHTMMLWLLKEEVNWEDTQDLPSGWMASEWEGRDLGVREGLNLRHQDLQQCLCSNIMHTMTLRLLEVRGRNACSWVTLKKYLHNVRI